MILNFQKPSKNKSNFEVYHTCEKGNIHLEVDKIIPSIKHRYMSLLKKKNERIYEKIYNLTSFLNEDISLPIRLIFIDTGFDHFPKCKTCHKEHSRIIQRKYISKYCSKKCMYGDKDYLSWRESRTNRSSQKEKMIKTNMERYGVEYQSQREINRKKLKESKLTPHQEQFLGNKKWLKNQYETKTTVKIAEELGVYYGTVVDRLEKFNIPIKGYTNRSQGEIDLFESLEDSSFISNDKTLINPYEIDILGHKHKLAIEYCGLYWHSDMIKPKTYHRDKMRLVNERGYDLITVFESDDISKVKSLIRSKIGLNERVFARKCEINEISPKEASQFHTKHHLSGKCGARHHIGLFYKGDLVMVNSIGKSRFGKNSEYECIRLTSHSDYSVVGGASKTFKYFVRKYSPKSIVTFADLRFGRGEVYNNCGFRFVEETYPNYWYFHKYSTILESRVKYQKHKLGNILDSFDSNLSEIDNMYNNGYLRIFDCGNAKYEYVGS